MSRIHLLVSAAAYFLAAGLCVQGVDAGSALIAREKRAVDDAIRAELRDQNAVGIAVGVLRDGRVAYTQGYGLADRESGTPVTARTVFNWASNSKPLVAVAAMQLVEAGRLSLDADVRQYVPEFPSKELGTITVRSLLCHQSGIPHYRNGAVIPIAPITPPVPECESAVIAIERFAGSPLLFPPGDRVSYSSHAYVLLSAVVARAGNDPLLAQIERRIAAPVDMRSLTADVDHTDQRDWAVGYVRGGDGAVVRAREYAHCWKHGAGGYKSNVRDFAQWAAALLAGRLVKPATQAAMWEPQSLSSGKPTTWGLGFTVGDQGGLKISHNGSQPETRTRMVLYPESGHGVVVMCNCEYANPGKFSTAVYTALRR